MKLFFLSYAKRDMPLTSKQMKMAAGALSVLWLIGLVAAILARRHRQKSGDAQHADRPLVVYLVVTGCLLLISGIVYYEMRKKAMGVGLPVGGSSVPDDIPPPEDATSPGA